MYVCSQLFGADDESDQQELDDAEKNGENGKPKTTSLFAPPFSPSSYLLTSLSLSLPCSRVCFQLMRFKNYVKKL